MPVSIRIDGKPAPWGSPRRGLSASERQEFDELHDSHRTADKQLHEYLGSPIAYMRKDLYSRENAQFPPTELRTIEQLCQRIETTRRALRGYLTDPDASVEWTWRYWVGRELAEMRGTPCIEITPGMRTAWDRHRFAYGPGLTRAQRRDAAILLKEWGKIVDELPEAQMPEKGGELLARAYAYELKLLPYSSYPAVHNDLPLPGGARDPAPADGGRQGAAEMKSRKRRFRIRDVDADKSDDLLREVLRLTDEEHLDARAIGVRLGARVGADNIPPGTIRFWRREGGRMRKEGLI